MRDTRPGILDICLAKNVTMLSGLDPGEVRECKDKRGAGPIHYAVRARGDSKTQEQILEYLIQTCACNIQAYSFNGAKPLHDACATGKS